MADLVAPDGPLFLLLRLPQRVPVPPLRRPRPLRHLAPRARPRQSPARLGAGEAGGLVVAVGRPGAVAEVVLWWSVEVVGDGHCALKTSSFISSSQIVSTLLTTTPPSPLPLLSFATALYFFFGGGVCSTQLCFTAAAPWVGRLHQSCLDSYGYSLSFLGGLFRLLLPYSCLWE